MRLITLLPYTALAALLAACSSGTADPAGPGPAVSARVIQARTVRLPETVTVPGTVHGARMAVLASRLGGQVKRVAVEAGERVAQGALLVEVDPAQPRAALAQAQAQEAAAEAAYAEAAADERRFHALYQEGAASAREYEQIHQRYETARAAQQAARQSLAAARADLAYAVVRAPFAGLIVERRVDPGDYAAPGVPLLVLAGGQPEVWAHVSETLYARLKTGTAAAVEVGGRKLEAVIVQIVSAADPQTRTHQVKLRLPKGVPVTLGAYASVRIDLGSRDVVAVPASAVVQRAGITGVFVVDGAGVARFRALHVAGSDNALAIVAAGLKPGEKVVAAPRPGIDNGVPIAAEDGHG